MNNIFRILLLGALPLAAFPVIQASAQEPDIQTLLSAERSSFISGKARDILCRKLGTANLDTDKIRAMAHAPQVALLCHLYQFFSTAENGEPFTQHELKDGAFRKWLSTHPEVFRMLALSGAAGKQTLSIFYRIWNANNKTLRPVETSMALGAGLASNVIPPEECLSKFNFYRESYFQSACHPQADTMQPWEWAIVFRGRESLEDLSWAQQFIEKKQIPPEQAGNKFMGFIPYRRKNLQGVSVHAGAAFYDHKPVTLKLYTEYGGVCGAVSKGAAGFLRAKGVPAWAIGQPGHCAFIWKHPGGHWKIGNNISGWNWSTGKSQIPWNGPVQLIPAYNAFIHHGLAEESFLMTVLSDCSPRPVQRELLLKEACKMNPFNYPAWRRYLSMKAKGINDRQKLTLLKELAQAMPHEHNLLHHAAVNILKIRESKVNPYELYACFLDPDCSPAAEELFTRLCWNKLVAACPEIGKIIKYREGFIGKHLSVWARKGNNASWTPKMKRYSAGMMEGAITALEKREQTRTYYVATYRRLLEIWNDKKLKHQGEILINKISGNKVSPLRQNR